MQSMFEGCEGFLELDVSHFNTTNVTNMSNMFYKCINLNTIDISGEHFVFTNVTTVKNMFINCSSSTNVYIKDLYQLEQFAGVPDASEGRDSTVDFM